MCADISQIYGTMKCFPIFLILLACTALPASAQFATPEPYGGKQAVEWMLDQELRFPPEALAAGIHGEVTVALKVHADGSVSNVHVTLPLDPACDVEAVRLAKLIRWKPASVSGTPLDKDQSVVIPFQAKRFRKQQAKATPCPGPEVARPLDPNATLYTDREVDTLAAPLVPGGLRALPQYIASNLKYPSEAYRLDIQGKVSIEFVVETSGHISNLRTLNFLGGGCDEEAMRLARSLCWTPAIKGGRFVRSIMKLDIMFRLDPSHR